MEFSKNDFSKHMREMRELEKARVLSNLGYEFHQGYKLGRDKRYLQWYLTNFSIDIEVEEVLVCMYYRTYDTLEDGWHGRIEYTYYLIKNGDDYYIKFYNMSGLEEKAIEIGKKVILNGMYCEEIEVGVLTNEYKKYVIDNVMQITPPLDKEELFGILNYSNGLAYSERYLEAFEYEQSKTVFDIFDFHNKNRFYADDYCLKKYSGIIDFSNYVFEKCGISILKKSNIEFVETIEEAQKITLFKAIDDKYSIL